MFSKMLICSDGSENALKAASAGASLAREFGSAVTIIHVSDLPAALSPAFDAVGFTIGPAEADRYADEVRDSVARRTGKVLEDSGITYETRFETGHPADVIARVANDEGFDLVVLGSRGLSTFKSFLLGSVSDRVAHHAHCPVLIVR